MAEVPVQSQELAAAWTRAVDSIGHSLGMRARAFITHVRPLAVVDGAVVVLVPNEWTKKEFEAHSSAAVAEALSLQLGFDVELVVELIDEPNGQAHFTPADERTHESGGDHAAAADPRPAGHPDAARDGGRFSGIPRQEDPLASNRTDEDWGGSSEAARPPFADSRSQAPAGAKTTRLNPRYTFDSFVIGPSNRFAHAAAVAAAEAPGKAYNPLTIYGESGLGKTHLLHAIGHYARHLFDGTVVRYVSSEEFTNEFINSIRDDRSRSFQRTYRGVDVLLIDDIQFLEGKEQTQEEFFHTFNTLHNANKQIVITSDRPPKELSNLEDRLRNRFTWGLLTDVQPPDLETRIAILSKKANADGIRVPGDVLELIAAGITRNIRELEGALVRVAALANLQKQPIDEGLATIALRDLVVDDTNRSVAPELIMRVTADYFDFDVDDLIGRSRKQPLATSRQIAMYLCRELTDLSLPKIGELFGGRDHTTVMHAENKVRKEMNQDRAVYNQLAELTNRIKQSRRP